MDREIVGVEMIGGNSREMGSVMEEGNKKSSPNGVTSSQTTGAERTGTKHLNVDILDHRMPVHGVCFIYRSNGLIIVY